MMRYITGCGRLFTVLLFMCTMLRLHAVAQDSSAHIIRLKSGPINVVSNVRQWFSNAAKVSSVKEPVQVLLHFTVLPDRGQQEILKQNGIVLLDYIPDNTYVAIISGNANSEKIQPLPIYGIIDSKPEWKADSYTWKKVNATQGQVEVLVSFYAGTGDAAIRQFIAGIGGRIDPGPMEQYGAYKVIIASTAVRSIAGWYGVRYISPVTEMVPLDLQSRPAVKGNVAVAGIADGGYGLLGDSVTVGVGDNTSGIFHVDMMDRVINYNPAQRTHHGVHVNGIVGGAGTMNPRGEGQAPHATLVDFFFDMILPATGAMYQDHNMTITNNSYTVIEKDCEYSGTYDLYSRLLDTLAVQYPEVQHVFASGNDGNMNCTPYLPGFATVGGGYQPAKNNIVVGSMDNKLLQATDESRGPVKDGRLKPDVIAVGYGVYSTIDDTAYLVAAGTSMASPQVAGGLASITQRYKQLHGGAQPRADLLKTILLNTAMDLGNPGPDYSYGFGAMDVARALNTLDNSQYRTGDINNGASQSYTITIPANTAQVKIMLCWNDLPASPSAASALINDLDIVVTDPSGGTHLPLGLDAAPARVNDNATERADHLNNAEQVTINNPAAGTYTITVKGYSVPYGPQHYVVAYDMVPKALQLTFPIGGEQLSNTDSIRVFWNHIPDGNLFTVMFSQDNGGSWQTLSETVPANVHYHTFLPSGINSGNCIVRVQRNGTAETMTSQRFAITDQPLMKLAASQCPGYMNVHWSAVPGATAYQLMKKVGAYMQVIDTATDTSYSFKGLSLTAATYVAVRPIVNGLPGYRSVAIYTVANSGDCSNPVSAGDLLMELIVSPGSGRMYTSGGFSASTPIVVSIKDLYALPCSNYTLSWQINGGMWQTLVSPGIIPANGALQVTLPAADLSVPGSYRIKVAVHNLDLPDPQIANDTTEVAVKNLANDPVSLATPFVDGFEDLPVFAANHDSLGVSPNAHWDYYNDNDSGRIRSFVYDNIAITGNRSVSLDERMPVQAGSKNVFTGTFNLSAYDTANTELRLDFDYILHGTPRIPDGNMVSVRASDMAPWSPIYSYNFNAYAGTVTNVRSLSLTDAVRLTGNNFTTSTQLAFGQNDTSLIAARNYGSGLTLDNVKLYTVANDAMLTKIISPLPGNCGLPNTVPLTVQVRNGVNYTLRNITLFYSMDSGTVYSGTLDSIKAKDTINFTFAQRLAIGVGSTHKVNVWLSAPDDTYLLNDTLLNYKFRNSNIVTAYPYLERFEAGDGGYYADGLNSSWQYGTPASVKVNRAASGTKAWKTNLTGRYNSIEKSYLYSPCFDISQLSNPMLSFSMAMDLENCGSILCDAAWVEYSYDGVGWTKLGTAGQGTNWYDATFNRWTTNGFTRWHVASIPLPQGNAGATLHLRFVLAADPAVNFEGLAIDDVHIYDLVHGIYPAVGVTSIAHDAGSGIWNDYLAANQLLAAVQPRSQSLSNATVTLYGHDTLSNPSATQYTFPRSYTMKAEQQPADSTGIRLYLLDTDVVRVLADTSCPSCTRIKDAYTLGITQYSNSNNAMAENGSLQDDTGGVFTYYPYNSIHWVPYDKGYYAQLTVRSLSEFWFNDGGPTGTFAAGVDYLNFVAFKTNDDVTTYWYSLIDTTVRVYVLERSADGVVFDSVSTLAAAHTNPAAYTYVDAGALSSATTVYYRLKWQMTAGNAYYYSPIRKVTTADSAGGLVVLKASMAGSKKVLVSWTSYIDGLAENYILERAVDNGAYTNVDNVSAVHRYGQQYYYTDMPDNNILTGQPLHYRLTVILASGARLVLPVQTVLWVNDNAVTTIYPNPTSDGRFTINWFAEPGSVMHVQLTDAVGKAMDEGAYTATQWSNTTTLHTNRRPKGVYFVKMEIGGIRYTAKLVYE